MKLNTRTAVRIGKVAAVVGVSYVADKKLSELVSAQTAEGKPLASVSKYAGAISALGVSLANVAVASFAKELQEAATIGALSWAAKAGILMLGGAFPL